MHEIRTGGIRLQRTIGPEGESQRMIRRYDVNDRSGAFGRYLVGIRARNIRTASEDGGLRKELHTKARRSRVNAVHANTWRSWCAFFSAEHGLEQIRLHGLHTS